MNDDEFQKLANAAYIEKFAERLTERGYGHLVKDEKSLTHTLQAVNAIRGQHEKAAEQLQPLVELLTDRGIDALLGEGQPQA